MQFAHSRLIMAIAVIWSSSKAKLSTVDHLEADRLEFHYCNRIAALVETEKFYKQAIWKLFRSCSVCMDCTEHCRHAKLNRGQH